MLYHSTITICTHPTCLNYGSKSLNTSR